MSASRDHDREWVGHPAQEYLQHRPVTPPSTGMVRVTPDNVMGVSITPGQRASDDERQAYRKLLEECANLGYLTEGELAARLSALEDAPKALLEKLVEDLPMQPELMIASSQRTSQEERDRITDHLNRCHAEGRLSQDQLDRRTDYIHSDAGVTQARLLDLIKDLPALTAPEEERTLWGMFPKSPAALHAMLDSMKWSRQGARARLVVYIASFFFGVAVLTASISALAAIHNIPVIGNIAGWTGVIAGVAWMVCSLVLALTDKVMGKEWN